MLDLAQTTDLIRQVAQQTLAPSQIEGVTVEPAVDSQGGDALRILLVLPASSLDHQAIPDG